ncbi:MAG: hypothetical protein GY856_03585 [bacterium]|nr:hypothetical protein [bacterium]
MYCQRPEAPLDRLAATLRLREQPGLYLVSGHIGTGKSTELLQLVKSLSDTHSCSIKQVDAKLWRGSTDEKTLITLLELALAGLGVSVRTNEDSALPDLERLRVQAHFVRRNSCEPLVVLDGFDKVELADLERVLTSVFSWSALPVSVVLTVPLSFLFTPMFARSQSQFAGTAVVPAIRVRQQDGDTDPAGVEWMRSMLSRRGVGELFDSDATEHLIVQTGGILRDFLRVARESVLTAHMKHQERVTLEYATDVIQDFSLNMSRTVSSENLRLLHAVHRAGRAIGDSSFLQMIDSGQIIEYRNGANWYAVHPLLREAIQALGTALESQPS